MSITDGVVKTYVNIICNGMPNFCAQWICAKLGGFAIMAWAMKGDFFTPPFVSLLLSSLASSASAHDFQQPSRISAIPLRLLPTSPSFSDFIPGRRPGFLTIKAINSVGSPPISKNSKPFSSTNFLNVPWVAKRIRWPYLLFNSRPRATKG